MPPETLWAFPPFHISHIPWPQLPWLAPPRHSRALEALSSASGWIPRLHVPRPSSTPLGPRGVLSLEQSQSTAPRPLSCRKLKSTARALTGQHLQWQLTPFRAFPGGARCPHGPSPARTPNALESPGKGDSVRPPLRKEGPLNQGRSGQNEALTYASNGTWKECVLSQRDRGQRGEGVGNQEAGAEKEGRGCVKQRGGRMMRGTCPFTLNRSQGIAKKPRNHSATCTAIRSNGFFGQPGF